MIDTVYFLIDHFALLDDVVLHQLSRRQGVVYRFLKAMIIEQILWF